MNLRFPVVAAIVGLAAGAAALRALQPRQSSASLTFASPAPSAAGSALHTGYPTRRVAPATIVVYVAGEVRRPGVYTLPATARGADALRAGGGPGLNADLVAVNLAGRLADGDEVAVPARGAPSRKAARSRAQGSAATTTSSRARHGRKRKRRGSAARSAEDPTAAESESVPTELVDLNAADVDVLQTLPGIGPALAERIVAVRDQSGPFASPDDLLDIGGMTQSKLDAISPYVTLR